MLRRLLVSLLCAASFGCGHAAEKSSGPPPADAHVRALADTYLAAWFERFPEQITEYGVSGHRQDKLTDNSLEAWKAWHDREDAWLVEAKQIDPRTISAPPLRATYAIVREALEGPIAFRACRNELWTVSQFVNAGHVEHEYFPGARARLEVSASRNGPACYDASVRFHSSLPIPAKEVHETGLRMVDQIAEQMKEIAQQSFQTSDVQGLLQKLRTDKKYTFKNREELIAFSQAALDRAKTGARPDFGLWPNADVMIQPYPAFREKNAPNEYNSPAEDGSRPGVFLINAYQPEKHSRVEDESTTFHETIPGHHLQGAIALERKDIHPIGRYISNSGYAEGWALYTERLADELKLFSSDVERLGMLSDQQLRAVRLVVDSGIHTMSWTRQQAIDYMLAHTAEGERDAASEVDRYIIYPGQAASYMLGMIEIRKARDAAEKSMGARFDIKAFHDRVLEDGGVPLTFLKDKIERWSSGN